MSRHVIVKPLVLAGVVGACAVAVSASSETGAGGGCGR